MKIHRLKPPLIRNQYITASTGTHLHIYLIVRWIDSTLVELKRVGRSRYFESISCKDEREFNWNTADAEDINIQTIDCIGRTYINILKDINNDIKCIPYSIS